MTTRGISLVRITVARWIGAIIAGLIVAISSSLAQNEWRERSVDDDARQIFPSGAFPWYDADSQSAVPLPFPKRPAPRSADRNSIPPSIAPATTNRNAPANRGSSQGMSVLFWVGLAIALVGVMALLIWTFLRIEARNRATSQSATRRSLAQSIEQLPFQLDTDTGDFQSLARRAYETGDFRRATIMLFSHVLVSLDQADLIRLRKGKTNRQYLRELNTQATLSAFFHPLMESFEAVFFGDHDISRTDFERNWNRLHEFNQAVEEHMKSQGAVL
jgi:hypothetical protein